MATTGRALYFAEHYAPGATGDELRERAIRIRAAIAALAEEGVPVRLVDTTIVPRDEAVLCVVGAPDERCVHTAFARAGVACDRLSPAEPLDVLTDEGD